MDSNLQIFPNKQRSTPVDVTLTAADHDATVNLGEAYEYLVAEFDAAAVLALGATVKMTFLVDGFVIGDVYGGPYEIDFSTTIPARIVLPVGFFREVQIVTDVAPDDTAVFQVWGQNRVTNPYDEPRALHTIPT